MDLDKLVADCIAAIYAGQWNMPGSEIHHKPYLDEKINVGAGPGPWAGSGAAAAIYSALSLKAAAAGLEGAQKEALEGQLNSQIMDFIDGCGTWYPHGPRHFPGPPPVGLGLASELALIASALPEGSFRQSLLATSTLVLKRTMRAADTA